MSVDAGYSRAFTGDDLNTPTWMVQLIRERYAPIALDPCSNERSIVGAEVEWSIDRGQDGLALDWHATIGERLAHVNPPYGSDALRKWVAKVIAERAKGVESTLLVPCWPDRHWWHAAIGGAQACAYLYRRVKFIGGLHGAGEFPSAVLYFGHAPMRFGAAFEIHADIRLVRPA